jgi:hypothetical protein
LRAEIRAADRRPAQKRTLRGGNLIGLEGKKRLPFFDRFAFLDENLFDRPCLRRKYFGGFK